MTDIKETFGQCVRYYRKSKKLSQEQLAEICELHPTYIGQLERGEKNASLETIVRLSKGLEISPRSFFENVSPDENNTVAMNIYNLCMKLPKEKQLKIYDIITILSEI